MSSNGARHVLGLVVGAVITPLTAAALMFATGQSYKYWRFLAYDRVEQIPAYIALAVSAVLLGLAAGSRLSPLASLVPGVAFTLAGAAWVVEPASRFTTKLDVFPATLGRGYLTLGAYGIFLTLGLLLLVASLSPSRWRAGATRGARAARRDGLPMEPAFGEAPPAFPQPWPAQGPLPPPGVAQPTGDSGSWTQVFGGESGADQGGGAALGGGPDPSPSPGPSPQ